MKKIFGVLFTVFSLLVTVTACSPVQPSALGQSPSGTLTPEQQACTQIQKISEGLSSKFSVTPGFDKETKQPYDVISSIDVPQLQTRLADLRDYVKYVPTWLSPKDLSESQNDLIAGIDEVSMHSEKLLDFIFSSDQIREIIRNGELGTRESFVSSINTLDMYKLNLTDSLARANDYCPKEATILPGPPELSSDASICKLPDRTTGVTSMPGTIFVGFPATPGFIPLTGTSTVLMLPVDWSDVPGAPEYINKGKQHAKMFSDYYRSVSNNKLVFDWKFYENWVRLPGSAEEYRVQGPFPHPKLIQSAIAAADPLVDFSGIAGVYLLLPETQEVMHEGTQDHYLPGKPPIAISNEGEILSYVASGKLFDEPGHRNIWSHWVHETAHFLNMPDLYDFGGQWEGEQLDIPVGPFSGFDMMSNQDGPTREINSWSRFIMGWLEDDEIYCQDFTNFQDSTFELTHLSDKKDNLKSVMIRLSETEALVVESRRPTNYDLQTNQSREGILVYTVDTTLGHGQGYLKLIAPEGRGLVNPGFKSVDFQYDAVLYEGDSINHRGITVYVDKLGKKDTVAVFKD